MRIVRTKADRQREVWEQEKREEECGRLQGELNNEWQVHTTDRDVIEEADS